MRKALDLLAEFNRLKAARKEAHQKAPEALCTGAGTERLPCKKLFVLAKLMVPHKEACSRDDVDLRRQAIKDAKRRRDAAWLEKHPEDGYPEPPVEAAAACAMIAGEKFRKPRLLRWR
jgi:hypothetical protein